MGVADNMLRKNTTDKFFDIFKLDDLFRKVLSDLYSSWQEILILCVASVGKWKKKGFLFI